ncbi:hypothetical protein S7335_2284 [Synechococcus sp. PCC 7335]|nr:hypothetical protein S7335_2284 [Synechococcus sp. PCC 7335]
MFRISAELIFAITHNRILSVKVRQEIFATLQRCRVKI